LLTAWDYKTAIPQLKITISAKPHQKLSKTASPQTLTPPSIYEIFKINEGVAALAPFFLWNVSEGYGKIPFECRAERKSGLFGGAA